MCRVCYEPSLSCAEFAMCRVVHNSKPIPLILSFTLTFNEYHIRFSISGFAVRDPSSTIVFVYAILFHHLLLK